MIVPGSEEAFSKRNDAPEKLPGLMNGSHAREKMETILADAVSEISIGDHAILGMIKIISAQLDCTNALLKRISDK